MSFGNPQILELLPVVLIPLGLFFIWAWRRRKRDITQFVRSRLLAHLTVGVSDRRQKIRLVLVWLAVGCVLLALARPRWGYTWEEIKQRGLDIVVAVDTSRSMLAEDVAPNRLTRAKLAALELIPRAKTDRLGLVAFAGTAFLQCPLTLDDEAFRQSVNAVEVGLIPQGGTAIGEAIQTALTAFKNDEDNEKIIVLLTDGEDHEEGAKSAAEAAAEAGVRIFTIGVGTGEGELLRLPGKTGTSTFVKDDEGNVVKSHLNEPLLSQIAKTTQGFYLPLRGANTMDVLYDRGLAPLLGRAKGTGAEKALPAMKRLHERFQWPLAFAIFLLLLEMFLPERRLVRRPAKAVVTPVAPQLEKMVALFVILAFSLSVQASPGKAEQLYQSGQYEAALKEYQRLMAKNPKDARLAFNAGAAAYQSKNFDEAAANFSDSLIAKDLALQERAYYNLGNTNFRLGEQAQDPGQKENYWQQATNSYGSALKLNSQDADARFNLDFVQRQLEELKKQQQEQKDKEQKQSQEQKKNDQDKQDKQDKNKKDQDQKQPPDNQKQPEKKDQDKQQPPKPNPSDSDNKNQKKNEKENKDGQAKQPPPAQNKSGETNQTSAAEPPPADGKMSRQQAQQLLDAQKNDEKSMVLIPREKRENANRIFKDW
jgi:Ca-activated chloride channel family protein